MPSKKRTYVFQDLDQFLIEVENYLYESSKFLQAVKQCVVGNKFPNSTLPKTIQSLEVTREELEAIRKNLGSSLKNQQAKAAAKIINQYLNDPDY
jgi:hypothetical protein